MSALTVAFDARLPLGRWAPLFQLAREQRPDLAFEWRPLGFRRVGTPLLGSSDLGVFLQPHEDPRVLSLTLDVCPMAVIMPVGHRLASHRELTVDDVLDETWPGGPELHPEWAAFWTLDEQRGGPARRSDDDVETAEDVVAVVAAGRAVATMPEWVTGGLSHPGVVTVPIVDAPEVQTCLLWRGDDEREEVTAVVGLATVWAAGPRTNGRHVH
jgi:DNA-binding transcriptional LysR family regulator